MKTVIAKYFVLDIVDFDKHNIYIKMALIK